MPKIQRRRTRNSKKTSRTLESVSDDASIRSHLKETFRHTVTLIHETTASPTTIHHSLHPYQQKKKTRPSSPQRVTSCLQSASTSVRMSSWARGPSSRTCRAIQTPRGRVVPKQLLREIKRQGRRHVSAMYIPSVDAEACRMSISLVPACLQHTMYE
jgi:hypothetical protein